MSKIDLRNKIPIKSNINLADWSIDKFNYSILYGELSSSVIKFRVYSRIEGTVNITCLNRTVREYECEVIVATLKDFMEWYNFASTHCLSEFNLFHSIPERASNKVFVYADYQHFAEIFCKESSHNQGNYAKLPNGDIYKSINWFGKWEDLISNYPATSDDHDKNTLWISTKMAHTPLHYDSFGCNVIVQLHGTKTWLLWKPDTAANQSGDHSVLSPCRIPFEESTVYSGFDPIPLYVSPINSFVNDTRSDLSKHIFESSTPTDKCPNYTFTLEAGDVLFVPPNYWHFVITTSELAISVNQWLPNPDPIMDTYHQLTESITRFTVNSLTHALDTTGLDTRRWNAHSQSSQSFSANDKSFSGWFSPSELLPSLCKFATSESAVPSSSSNREDESNQTASATAAAWNSQSCDATTISAMIKEDVVNIVTLYQELQSARLKLCERTQGDEAQNHKRSKVSTDSSSIGSQAVPQTSAECLLKALLSEIVNPQHIARCVDRILNSRTEMPLSE